MGCELTERIC